jgi:hypothetical protein
MRAKVMIPGLGLLILFAVMFLAFGCSSDSSPTSTKTAGSETDHDYLLVQGQIDVVLDSAIQFFSTGFDNYNLLPNDDDEVQAHYSPGDPSATTGYGYYPATGWYEFYVSRDNGVFTDHMTDSLLFKADNSVTANPGDADYMHYIHHWDFASKLTSQTYTDYDSSWVDLEFTDLDDTQAQLNGTAQLWMNWNYVSIDTTIDADYNVFVYFNDVGIDEVPTYGFVSGCPSEGQFSFAIYQSYTLDDGTTPVTVDNVRWNATVEFENGLATVRITNADSFWNYSRQVCVTSGS